MKQFVIVVTREARLRLVFMRKEHGLLYDSAEKKVYAIVRDAYPTNWLGRWARAYLVYEESAQSIEVGRPEPIEGEAPVDGSTVEVLQPLSTVARIRVNARNGEEGRERDVYMTPETLWDRTMSAQVRRLGNRKFQWFHALLFACVGVAVCLLLVGVITLFSASHATTPTPTQTIPGTTPSPGPTSGPVHVDAPGASSNPAPIPRSPTPG